MKFRNMILMSMASAAAAVSCTRENGVVTLPGPLGEGISFTLSPEDYADAGAGNSGPAQLTSAGPDGYDRVEFAVIDMDGKAVGGLKGFYDQQSSSVNIEGLREGSYRLLVLGVKGDYERDGVEFFRISDVSDTWMTFPEDMESALSAEYFHSSTPFSVKAVHGDGGKELVADVTGAISQRRVVGRLDFSHEFANPHTESAVLSNEVILDSPRFFTGMSADGAFTGTSSAGRIVLDAAEKKEFLFMPTVEGERISGENEIITRDYRGVQVRRVYSFAGGGIVPNHVNGVRIEAVHPDDETGTMFITEKHYIKGGHGTILSDDEHHSVYTDASQRRFNTSEPLQISVEEGRLHVRFYSPKPLSDVLVKAVLPGTDGEYVDLAWFDRIPAFADFYETLPMAMRTALYRSESGRLVEIPATDAHDISITRFKVESEDPYWSKLQDIRHGWNITFSLYGGDPDREDGGPAGNWMGIRPVHCREAVALFLNFTYMIDMPEHEEILHENQDRLYGNGGPDDKVTPETVLAQMRQERSINVGLVYTGNGVLGLGGGNVFGAYQGGWFNHYTSEYACEVMFHELGHVMGYSHSSAFTYGPWAQELMNRFYVSHISSMPVDSPEYLDSRNSPYLYASQPKSISEDHVRMGHAGICGAE